MKKGIPFKDLPKEEQVKINEILPKKSKPVYIKYRDQYYPLTIDDLPSSLYFGAKTAMDSLNKEEANDESIKFMLKLFSIATGIEKPDPTTGELSFMFNSFDSLMNSINTGEGAPFQEDKE